MMSMDGRFAARLNQHDSFSSNSKLKVKSRSKVVGLPQALESSGPQGRHARKSSAHDVFVQDNERFMNEDDSSNENISNSLKNGSPRRGGVTTPRGDSRIQLESMNSINTPLLD